MLFSTSLAVRASGALWLAAVVCAGITPSAAQDSLEERLKRAGEAFRVQQYDVAIQDWQAILREYPSQRHLERNIQLATRLSGEQKERGRSTVRAVLDLVDQGRFQHALTEVRAMSPDAADGEAGRVAQRLEAASTRVPDQLGEAGEAPVLRRSVAGWVRGDATGKRQAWLCAAYAGQVRTDGRVDGWLGFLREQAPDVAASVAVSSGTKNLPETLKGIVGAPLGWYDEGERVAAGEDALLINPQDRDVLRELGNTYFRMVGKARTRGKVSEARAHLERCRELWRDWERLAVSPAERRNAQHGLEAANVQLRKLSAP